MYLQPLKMPKLQAKVVVSASAMLFLLSSIALVTLAGCSQEASQAFNYEGRDGLGIRKMLVEITGRAPERGLRVGGIWYRLGAPQRSQPDNYGHYGHHFPASPPEQTYDAPPPNLN